MSRFAPVPTKPNCVSSRAPSDDRQHFIEALTSTTLQKARDAALAWPRTELLEETDTYVHLVCTTAIFRFKDDLELEQEGDVLHVRSASRVGHSDMGVNRKRVETLRKALA